MFELHGKTAWVTGSARNLGRQMAHDMARQGADIVISNKSNDVELEATIQALREQTNVDVMGVQLDIGDKDQVSEAIDSINDELGGVDILVNNAAIRPHDPLEDLTLDQWEHVIRTNLTGTYLCSQAVLPQMRESGWGRIINIAGVDSWTGLTDRIHSISAKTGVVGLTRGLATELADDGILVNCIAPGAFDTTRDDEWYPELEDLYKIQLSRICLSRLGQPEEIAAAVVFLAAPENSYMTGQVLHVNGGMFPAMKGPTNVNIENLTVGAN